jgi:anthranilate phosphoribosyltransferase
VTGVNYVSHLLDGEVTTLEMDPLAYDIPRAAAQDLLGGDPADNAAITRAILSGKARGARRDVVLLNAAAVLSVVDNDWERGLAAAREAVDSGAALEVLKRWIAMTRRF